MMWAYIRELGRMAADQWKLPPAVQPRARFARDLGRAVLGGRLPIVPGDAFTADTLGVERAGNGVLIDSLVRRLSHHRAETVWLHQTTAVVQGHGSASIRKPASAWCRRSAASTCRCWG